MDNARERGQRSAPKLDKETQFSFERSAESLQDNLTRSAPYWAASYTLVGAILLLGAIGYVLDRWLNTDPWFLLAGLTAGIVVGFNELIKATWKR